MPRKPANYKIPHVKADSASAGLLGSRLALPPGSVPDVLGGWIRRRPGWENDYEWTDNVPFDANLKFIRLNYCGKAEWVDTATGSKYFMSIGSLEKVLLKKSLLFGTVLATWKFKKHGWSYSITLVC